jgi:hypothetical protein
MEPDTFEVEVFMAVAEDKCHNKIPHKTEDSDPQHNGDIDSWWGKQAFIRFVEDKDGDDKQTQPVNERRQEADPLISEGGVPIRIAA